MHYTVDTSRRRLVHRGAEMNAHLKPARVVVVGLAVIGASLLLALSKPTLYGVLVPLSALALAVVPGALPKPSTRWTDAGGRPGTSGRWGPVLPDALRP